MNSIFLNAGEIMEKKSTPLYVYILLIAGIVAIGVFIFQRIAQNASDREHIDKTIKAADEGR
jgi:F0F1-type ATP synthase assembly protein I